jgi:hypothetical protein
MIELQEPLLYSGYDVYIKSYERKAYVRKNTGILTRMTFVLSFLNCCNWLLFIFKSSGIRIAISDFEEGFLAKAEFKV